MEKGKQNEAELAGKGDYKGAVLVGAGETERCRDCWKRGNRKKQSPLKKGKHKF